MALAIFQDWFVDFGPVRAKLEGREPYLPPELWAVFPDRLVDSELGEIPRGWEVKALGGLVKLNPESWSRANSPLALNMLTWRIRSGESSNPRSIFFGRMPPAGQDGSCALGTP